jgi:cell shape-determining protein MreC
VRAKDVVYAAQGVVGQVIEVAPLSCIVLLLIDGESGRVGAMTSRTMAKGIFERNRRALVRNDLPR